MDDEEHAPGWDAIDAAPARIYGSQPPRHAGYHTPRGSAGSALQGCSACAADGHWHYISYGLSELCLPAPDADRQVSGWGFEPGHRLDLRAPVTGYPHIDGAPGTGLTVYAVLTDPQLGQISTPNGRVTFLQLVGVSAAEKSRY